MKTTQLVSKCSFFVKRWVRTVVASAALLSVPLTSQAWNLEVYVIPTAGGTLQTGNTTLLRSGLASNQFINLTASPNTDWKFTGWTSFDPFEFVNGTSSSNQVRISSTNNTDVTLYANFVSTIPQYSLTLQLGAGGLSVSPTGTTSYARGYVKSISAMPSNTAPNIFVFDQWLGDIAGIANALSNNTTITMDDNKVIQATFKQRFTYTGYDPAGPSSGALATNIYQGVPFTAQPSQTPVAGPSTGWRRACNGWTDGTGDIPSNGVLPFYSIPAVSASSGNRWTWTNEYNLIVDAQVGYNVVSYLGSNNWFTQGQSVTLSASAKAGYEFLGWEVNATNSQPPGPLTITMNGPTYVVAQFSLLGSDSDGDGLPDKWEKEFGLNPSSAAGNDGANGDPDHDGLSNLEEFGMQMTNRNWKANPLNADTDGDGMDDGYERYSVDATNSNTQGQGAARDVVYAALDDGRLDKDNGPAGNRDADYHWSTTSGYQLKSVPLTNIEEWRGPDGRPPVIYSNVTFAANYPGLYPFANDRGTIRMALPNKPPYNTVDPDTDDQSKGNVADTDGDKIDDGYEWSWDQWQQVNSGSNEVFMIGCTNMIGLYITNTVPDWTTERYFNPGQGSGNYGGSGPDNDVLYDYKTGKVSIDWYTTLREYHAWQPTAFSSAVAGAPHFIRMDNPPPDDTAPQRSSHPFLIDVDKDGLPDGYEVIFGYDPWAKVTPGNLYADGVDNPDGDWMAKSNPTNAVALRNHEVYLANGFDPRVAVDEVYPVAKEMPGKGTKPSPTTAQYSNREEMWGPNGVMALVPGTEDDDATNPFKYDSDADGIWDGWENYVGLNPNSPLDAPLDPDKDELANLAEFQSFYTSSTNRLALVPVDTWWNKIFPTDPGNVDTDGDGIKDSKEMGFFNGTMSVSNSVVMDEDGNVSTQSFTVATWNGKAYTGGGLNPTSADTDADTLPDPYEAAYKGALDGTLGDSFADPDGDRLPNYLEYYSCSVYHWQYDVWQDGQPSYDSGDFYNAFPKSWDWSQKPYIPVLDPPNSKINAYAYSGSNPGLADTDLDGLDDYYEVFHGLNPAYGIIDMVVSKYLEAEVPIGIFSPVVGDPRTMPFVNGSPFMDSDGDGIPNSAEGVNSRDPYASPQHHTDPTPLWMTDSSYSRSWVNLYYVPGSFWPWSGLFPPPMYAYSFESNEGFDTDNDGPSDIEELNTTKTDPLSPEHPIKRRALYLPQGLTAYARTFPGYSFFFDALRSFTVEAWVRPINPTAGQDQVVVERPMMVPIGNPMNLGSGVRLNFRLGFDGAGVPYVAYTGEGRQSIFYEAKAPAAARLPSNTWSHLCGTYQVGSPTDPTQRGTLTLYVNGEIARQSNPDELPSIGYFGAGTNIFALGAPIIVGAADLNPSGTLDGTDPYGTPPSPVNFFKGWIDEVRVWNGARTQPQVVAGMKRRMKQSDVENSRATTTQLAYLFSFDGTPDPTHSPTAPAGLGFDVTANAIFPANWPYAPWWGTCPARSQVYSDYRYVPWFENAVAHTPFVPPLDIGDPGVVFVSTNATGNSTNILFRNTSNPYGMWYKTAPALGDDESFLYDDLLPLGYAETDEDVAMWDGGGTPAIDTFDSDGDGMPDAWEEANGLDPLNATGDDGPDADLDGDGLSNYYEYLCGTDPRAVISNNGNVRDDELDSDGDRLSNRQELQHGTLPNIKDTDDDGLTDWEEVTGKLDASWVRPATASAPKSITDPLNPLSPSVPRSAYLNGSSRVIVPPSDKLMSKDWTVELWVNPDTNGTGGVLVNRYVEGLTASEYGINYEIGLTTNSVAAGKVRPYLRFVSTTNGVPSETRLDGLGATEMTNGLAAVTFAKGQWTHLAGSFNSASNVMSLYINGQLATYRTDASALPPIVFGYGTGHRNDEVTVGASRSTGVVSNGFKGYIDNVRIWSITRTAEEIADRYNAPEGVPSGSAALTLKSGTIAIGGGVSAEVTALAAASPARVLVKFDSETSAKDLTALSAAGVQVLNYVAPGVRAVKATSAQLSALGSKVTWAGVLKSTNKISPKIAGVVTMGSRNVLVTFYKDVAVSNAVQVVNAVGGTVYQNRYIGGADLVATVTDAQLSALAARNEVAWVMPSAAFLTSGGPVYRLSAHIVGGVEVAPFAVVGDGWDGPGKGSADLTYHFINYNSNLDPAVAKKAVVDPMFKWAAYAALTFTETTQSGRPYSMDILWEQIDGPSGVLGFGYFPNDINPEPVAGDFHLDSEETWSIGPAAGKIDLEYVALHEEGHCLGIGHSDDPNAIMYPYYDGSRDATLAQDDIDAIQSIYGKQVAKGTFAEFRFDDGGTSAQDFTVLADWKTGWKSAAIMDGAVFATNSIPPLNKDSDNDGLPDWWEMANGLNAYDGTGINGGAGDPDGDGLSNMGEYMARTDPQLWDTDGDGFSDYDSRAGNDRRTWGELYDDGDGIPDLWEVKYPGPCPTTGKRGLDPAYYDANLDPDEDGWDNYSEYLAGTDPLDPYKYPDPLTSIRVRYHGRWGSSLPEALNRDAETHGGSTLLIEGAWPGANELQAIAYPPISHLVGSLQNGDVCPGTVHFRIGDYLPVYDPDTGHTNYVERSFSLDLFDDMYGHLIATGTVSGATITGNIDYSSGGWSLDISGLNSYCEIFAGYKYWFGGQLKLMFYKSASMDGWPTATLKMDSEYQETRVFTSGHLWQGSNYVFCYMDRDLNNQWNPELEPAGIGQFVPINVGYGSTNIFEIGLTDYMPGYPRFSWKHDPTAYRYVLTNVSGTAVSRVIEAGSEWNESEHHWIGGARNYWHEGDWLNAGTYGAATGSVVFLVFTNEYPAGYMTNVVTMVSGGALGTPSIATPNGSLQFQYAKNELEFKVDANAAAYRLQIAASSNGTPILAITNIVPYMDINGNRKITLPFYVGDNYVPSGGTYASSKWGNGQYWARVQAFNAGASSSYSPWSSIIVDVQPPVAGGKSMISGDVWYFGKVGHGYGTGQTSNLTVIVQAFESSGFSGVADGQVQVTYTCNTNAPSANKGAYSMMGLRNVPYYIRAFIDENGNRKLDSWEPMGFAQQVTSNGYAAVAVDLSGQGSSAKSGVKIVIRDRDTDDDALPDGWEWMYYGTLANCASNISASTNLTLLRCYEIEPADLDPTKTDYDNDGVSDVDEITYDDLKAGRTPDVNHYNAYDPVLNPTGTDLNPTKWDTDGDGLSDGYEIAHGLNPLDPSDGAAQISRIQAAGGTIPGIPRVSQVAVVTPDSGQFSLLWEGQVGMSYEVQYSDDLKSWTPAAGGERYGASIHTYLDQSPKVMTRFYRVVVK